MIASPIDSPWSLSSLPWPLSIDKAEEIEHSFPNCARERRKLRVQPFASGETTTMNGSLKWATIRSIVLGTLWDKIDALHTTIHCLSFLLSNFTTLLVQIIAKMAFSTRSSGQDEEEETVVWGRSQWVNCTLHGSKEEQTFVWATYLIQSVANKLHHLGENHAFSALFQRSKGQRGGWKGLWVVAAGLSIVLWMMTETMDPLLGAVYCPDLLLSNFTTLLLQNGVFDGFCRLKRQWWSNLTVMLPMDRLYLMQW